MTHKLPFHHKKPSQSMCKLQIMKKKEEMVIKVMDHMELMNQVKEVPEAVSCLITLMA